MSSSTQVVFRTAVLLRGLNQPGATGNNQMINQPNIQVQGLHFNKSFNYNCDITKSETVPQKLNIKITFFIQTGFKNLSTDTKPGPKRFKGLSLWIWCQWVFNVWKQLRGSVLCSHSVSKIYYSAPAFVQIHSYFFLMTNKISSCIIHRLLDYYTRFYFEGSNRAECERIQTPIDFILTLCVSLGIDPLSSVTPGSLLPFYRPEAPALLLSNSCQAVAREWLCIELNFLRELLMQINLKSSRRRSAGQTAEPEPIKIHAH